MKRFLLTKPGILSLVAFTLLMAFMLHRVLSPRKSQMPPAAQTGSPVLLSKAAVPATKVEVSNAPVTEKGSLDTSLQKDLVYLDRLRESGDHSRTDRDREGMTITRRRTATPSSQKRKQEAAQSFDTAAVSSGKTLRLSGRLRETPSPQGTQATLPPEVPSSPAPPTSTTTRAASSSIPSEPSRFVPYGRPIKCELVFTIDSTMEETPLVGLVVEPVHNNGVLVIPAGTEIHGMARPDRLRDRIFSGRDWVLVLPREASSPSGRQLNIKGLALDRIEPQASGLTWGITDGSYGLQGSVIRTMESEEIKRFAATFVSAAALTLQERQSNARGGRSVASTPANAALQGIASSLEGMAREITSEIERNGVFIRIAGGKQFYFYPQQIIAPDRASIPLTP